MASTELLYDRNGSRIGLVLGGVTCVNRLGVETGRLSADIDNEAAGGACILLLLR